MGTPDLDAILSQDNPDIDVFSNAAAPVEPAAPVADAATDTQETTEQKPPATATTATDANPFDDGSAQHKAFERLREAERGRAEAEREAAVLRAIQERDQQWQQSMATQQQQQAADPYVDPLEDPEGHAAWVQRQIAGEVAKVEQKFEQREQQRQAQDFERQTQALIASTGVPVETIQAALAHVQQQEPWMVGGLNNAPNPFKAVLEHAKRIGFDAPAGPAKSTATTSIPDHIRQQVLADEAAKRAAAGLPPQMQTPRGVGSGPTGAGFSDALPPPSEFSKLSAAEYEAVKAKILSQ